MHLARRGDEKPDVVADAHAQFADILLNIHLKELREKVQQTQVEMAQVLGLLTEGRRRKAKSLLSFLSRLLKFGSSDWTRTSDIRINSPPFYRLNYRGIV